MSQSNNEFSQFAAEKIATAERAVLDKITKNRLDELVRYFTHLTSNSRPSMLDFSEKVVEMVQNPFFDDAERSILHTAILSHMESMHSENGIEPYLQATADSEVAMECLERFFAHEPDFESEISYNSPLAWDLRRALGAFLVLLPELAPVFARTVQKMFPKLPPGADGTGGLRGIIAECAEIGVDQGIARMVGSNGQDIIRRPIIGTFDRNEVIAAKSIFPTPATPREITTYVGSREAPMGSLGDAIDPKVKEMLERLRSAHGEGSSDISEMTPAG